jgi:pimeloyl-ACP methyl ester carboxylesterase
VAGARDAEVDEPLLVLHGFPSCSFDFRLVLDDLRCTRQVLLLDLLGYGLSAKPDQRYTLAEQADVVTAFTAELGVTEVALLTTTWATPSAGSCWPARSRGAGR